MVGGSSAARNVSAGAVAAIAAWSSYSHMVDVALAFGERPEVAYALPFSVDGMLIVASVVMVDDKRRSHRVRPVARLAFTAGVLASVAANVAAAQPSAGARIVAAWPAVALLLVVEMLARPTAPAATQVPPTAAAEVPPVTAGNDPPAVEPIAAALRSADGSAEVPAQPTADVPPVANSRTRDGDGAAVLPLAAAGDLATKPATPRKTAVLPPLGATDVPPQPPPAGHSGVAVAEPEDAPMARDGHMMKPPQRRARSRRPAATTRRLARQIIETEPHLSRAEVAARLGVSTRRLREVLAAPA